MSILTDPVAYEKYVAGFLNGINLTHNDKIEARNAMTIKELRGEKGLSQGKFAESIGIGLTAIVGYEKGKFKPSAEVAAKIKEVYGVDIAVSAPAEEKKPVKRGKKKAEAAPAVEDRAEMILFMIS